MTKVIVKIEEAGGVKYDLHWSEDSQSTATEKRQAETLCHILYAALGKSSSVEAVGAGRLAKAVGGVR